MTIGSHLTSFAGYQVKEWQQGQVLENLDQTIYRIAIDYNDRITWPEKFAQYLAQPNADQTKGLVLGYYHPEMFEIDCQLVLDAVIAAKAQLPLLDTLFVNDITYDENEISWIVNTDNAPLIHAFPKLKHFGVRGGNGLGLTALDAPLLETLIIQAGGLSAELITDVVNAHLPKLTHLELYLGTEEYGYSGSVQDLQPIFDDCFNNLTYLGLKNCDDQDQITKAVVKAPVIKHLQTLDLSLGTLSDAGGQAILQATSLTKLKHLDLSFHYLSEEMVTRLQAFAEQIGFTIDLTDPQEDDVYDDDDEEEVYRYVSIGE